MFASWSQTLDRQTADTGFSGLAPLDLPVSLTSPLVNFNLKLRFKNTVGKANRVHKRT